MYNSAASRIKASYCLHLFIASKKLWWSDKKELTKMEFICEERSKSFTAKRNLTCHQKYAYSSKRFSCHVCCELFARKDALSRHKRKHEEDATVHPCNNCSKRFYCKDMLKQHMIYCRTNVRKNKSCDSDDSTNQRKKQ